MSPEEGMRRALVEARKALGYTHPNPAVGAVIWHQGRFVATGHTAPVGGPHAEVRALQAFGGAGHVPDSGTILFVTLEPCSTQGRTPACTDAILRSGIRNVVVGAIDPNPQHQGRGIRLLRERGLNVTEDILSDECEDLNLIFNHWILERRPFIAAKIATTIDGRIALRSGDSKWITGPRARLDVMKWRHVFPAIAVGANTILVDDPKLTVRLEEEPERAPRRLIFDRQLSAVRQRPQARVFTDRFSDRTVLVTDQANAEEAEAFAQGRELQVWPIQGLCNGNGWEAFDARCRESGVTGIFVEGGSGLLSSLLRERRLDYLFAYRAPKVVGDNQALGPFAGFDWTRMQQVFRLRKVRHASFDDDQLMRGFIEWQEAGQ